MLKRVLFSFVVVCAAVYLADIAILQLRQDPTSTVTVHPYTAIPRKDKKEEFLFDDPQDETCLNSLFPHQHTPPCWYLRRHPEKRTDL
jgi:hypothetical protein